MNKLIQISLIPFLFLTFFQIIGLLNNSMWQTHQNEHLQVIYFCFSYWTTSVNVQPCLCCVFLLEILLLFQSIRNSQSVLSVDIFIYRWHTIVMVLNLLFSEIYCSGDVLHTIQMAHIFNDSKTFVDMKLKKSPKETVQLFKEFMAQHNERPTRDDLINFVSVRDKFFAFFDQFLYEFIVHT